MELLANYPMVEAVVTELQYVDHKSTDVAIEVLHAEFDREGPYATAKKYGYLVNNSGEEFAIQFMSFYNAYIGYSCY
jgi:hypothetical protein